jgi:integrase/recombinase XerD
MKHLPFLLETAAYIQSAKDFREYLYALGYRPHTCESSPANVKEFLYRMEMRGVLRQSDITREDIEEYYEYLQTRPNYRRAGGLSSKAISMQMSTLRRYFDYLEQTGQLTANPYSSLHYPSAISSPSDILTQEEIKQLYGAARSLREIAILDIFYGCGLRKSEAEKLNTEDIHFRTRILYVREGKGKKRRAIPITEKIAGELKRYYLHERSTYISSITPDNETAFILNKWGTRMNGPSYFTLIKEIAKNTEIKKRIHLHILRHSIASHLLENGLPIEYIREFLGHEFLETTQIYTRVSEKLLQQIHTPNETTTTEHKGIPSKQVPSHHGNTLPAGNKPLS